MRPKPRHLNAEYAAQFEDASVARVYRTRPPYPTTLFDVLESLLPSAESVVLDLGCGTGEIAIPMSQRVQRVDAVDPSVTMLEVAKAVAGRQVTNIRWINQTAEAFTYLETYGLVIAASSLHWMDWSIVLPKLERALDPAGFLAIVEVEAFQDGPWLAELRRIIPEYSTNQDYRRFDLINELSERGLFEIVGRETIPPEPFTQSVDDYVESFHARNGLSRQRMTREAAARFDDEVRRLVDPFSRRGMLRTRIEATVVWGTPDPRS